MVEDKLKTLNEAFYSAIDTKDTSALRKAILVIDTDIKEWGPEIASHAITYSAIGILELLNESRLDWSGCWYEQDDNSESLSIIDALFSQSLFRGVTTAEVAKFLLAHGANVNRTVNGCPLLSCFLSRSANVDANVFDALLTALPDVDASDSQGTTALMYAVSRQGDGRIKALEHLLAAGADPFKRDLHGKTAADWAAGIAAPAYLDVLRRHGLDNIPANEKSVVTMPPFLREMQKDSYFILAPIGDMEPLSLCWAGLAATSEAALNLVEDRFGWSRSPIGPFPVMQFVSATDFNRTANPHAVRHVGSVMPGNFVVICFTAIVPKEAWSSDADSINPRPIFVISGVFPAEGLESAQSFADIQTGWSLIARLEALHMMADGYSSQIEVLETK